MRALINLLKVTLNYFKYFSKAQGCESNDNNNKKKHRHLAVFHRNASDWLIDDTWGWIGSSENNKAQKLSFHILCLPNGRESRRMIEITENSITSVIFLLLVVFFASQKTFFFCSKVVNSDCLLDPTVWWIRSKQTELLPWLQVLLPSYIYWARVQIMMGYVA